MRKQYNKLVRDRIPDICKQNGQKAYFRILDDIAYKKELENKLLEELNEVLQEKGAERVLELADMLEVIRALALLEGVSFEQLVKKADEKALKRGAFTDKIFLEYVEDKI